MLVGGVGQELGLGTNMRHMHAFHVLVLVLFLITVSEPNKCCGPSVLILIRSVEQARSLVFSWPARCHLRADHFQTAYRFFSERGFLGCTHFLHSKSSSFLWFEFRIR